MLKKCKNCSNILESTVKGKQCRSCLNKKQRIRRKINNNKITKKYEKTHKGFLVRLYRNMKSRIEGIQKEKKHLYEGKKLLEKEDFYKWALSNEKFLILFEVYKKSDYNRKLAPSVDRIDSTKGYILENMEWVTTSENSRRGTINRNKIYGNPSKSNK